MPLAFTPSCRPVLRGGLPHSNIGDALALTLATTPELPSWAGLPRRSFRETPLALAAAGLPGLTMEIERERLCVDRAAAERGADRVALAYLRGDMEQGVAPGDYSTGLHELQRLAAMDRQVQALKSELLGPVSASLLLTDEQERPLASDPSLRETLLQHLALRISWLHHQLGAGNDAVIICLDEPFLEALSSPLCPLDWSEGGDMIARLVEGVPACCGLCLSGAVNWPVVLSLPVDLILIDADLHSAELVRHAPAVAAFLERGGAIGWGMIATDQRTIMQQTGAALARRFLDLVRYLADATGIGVDRLLEMALLTTSGSLAGITPAAAEHAAHLCSEVSLQVRAQSARLA